MPVRMKVESSCRTEQTLSIKVITEWQEEAGCHNDSQAKVTLKAHQLTPNARRVFGHPTVRVRVRKRCCRPGRLRESECLFTRWTGRPDATWSAWRMRLDGQHGQCCRAFQLIREWMRSSRTMYERLINKGNRWVFCFSVDSPPPEGVLCSYSCRLYLPREVINHKRTFFQHHR